MVIKLICRVFEASNERKLASIACDHDRQMQVVLQMTVKDWGSQPIFPWRHTSDENLIRSMQQLTYIGPDLNLQIPPYMIYFKPPHTKQEASALLPYFVVFLILYFHNSLARTSFLPGDLHPEATSPFLPHPSSPFKSTSLFLNLIPILSLSHTLSQVLIFPLSFWSSLLASYCKLHT